MVKWDGRDWVSWHDPKQWTPEDSEKVLCCTLTKKGIPNYVLGYYIPETKTWACGMNSNVVAWMRLPDWPEEARLNDGD